MNSRRPTSARLQNQKNSSAKQPSKRPTKKVGGQKKHVASTTKTVRKNRRRLTPQFLSALLVAISLFGLVATVVATSAFSHHTKPILKIQHTVAKQHPKAATTKPAAVQPVPITQPVVLAAPQTSLPALASQCTKGTLLTVVAHEDDDILFTNPDLQDALTAGSCIRTVFLTAGDDGQNNGYWQEREQGPLAAYAAMYDVANVWYDTTYLVATHSVTVYTLKGQPKVALVFLRLPDGNIDGQGFGSTSYQSLEKLRDNEINSISSIDGGATYTRDGLINTLEGIMVIDQPTAINTQAFAATLDPGDHSDHQATGYFTSLAWESYNSLTTLRRYMGYPIRGMDANLTDEQVQAKNWVFDHYEVFDRMICKSQDACSVNPSYQSYLSRQYQQTTPLAL